MYFQHACLWYLSHIPWLVGSSHVTHREINELGTPAVRPTLFHRVHHFTMADINTVLSSLPTGAAIYFADMREQLNEKVMETCLQVDYYGNEARGGRGSTRVIIKSSMFDDFTPEQRIITGSVCCFFTHFFILRNTSDVKLMHSRLETIIDSLIPLYRHSLGECLSLQPVGRTPKLSRSASRYQSRSTSPQPGPAFHRSRSGSSSTTWSASRDRSTSKSPQPGSASPQSRSGSSTTWSASRDRSRSRSPQPGPTFPQSSSGSSSTIDLSPWDPCQVRGYIYGNDNWMKTAHELELEHSLQ